MSSMRRMVMAASVAKRSDLILEIAGSRTPRARLSRVTPLTRSRPVCFSSGWPACCEAWCAARSVETSSMASCAALTDSVRGMTRSASANSAMASCSRVVTPREYASRWMERAASTAPPPATTADDSRTRLTTMRTSCSARSSSSKCTSLAPRRTTVVARAFFVPRTYNISPSPTRSSETLEASPRHPASNVSLPSMSASVTTIVAPVARARRVMSSFFTRRAAMAPASTKYFKHVSSMPFVVRMTLAPEARIFWMRSLVMSSSRCLMPSTSSGFSTWICTPICTLCRCSGKSSRAILAPTTTLVMPCAARATLRAKPSATSSDSVDDLPCAFKMWMAETG
mmetsp:Transcript_11391/g.38034  ORF Transcript_11391/g.38034 Transcript_11391/m.38034 type:complete len:341 (-) Transcript_11391:665-1687(-)